MSIQDPSSGAGPVSVALGLLTGLGTLWPLAGLATTAGPMAVHPFVRLGLVLSLSGVTLGLAGCRRRDAFRPVATLGLIMNGVTLLALGGVMLLHRLAAAGPGA